MSSQPSIDWGAAELPLGSEAPARLARLRAEVGCTLPDCCVLLAAREHGGTVASFDPLLVDAADGLGRPTVEQLRARAGAGRPGTALR